MIVSTTRECRMIGPVVRTRRRALTITDDLFGTMLENELRRIEEAQPLRERLRPLQERVLARPATGLNAEKDFYDDLSRPA